ncbi:MAG: DoxX family protein [Sulfitobacter sp.]
MNALKALHRAVFGWLENADWLLPTLARLMFAGILLMYFWVSALTKIGTGFGGIFTLDDGVYMQIFPRAMAAVGYDSSQLGLYHKATALVGTWAEFALPLLIVVGFLTRLAALGLIGFITVQSLTDLFAHGKISDAKVLGAWFDRFPDAMIMDQRAFWVFLLLVLVIKGAGPVSFDRAIGGPPDRA